jgi:hypothetical protein
MRSIIAPPIRGGKPCPALSGNFPCPRLLPCPVDCRLSPATHTSAGELRSNRSSTPAHTFTLLYAIDPVLLHTPSLYCMLRKRSSTIPTTGLIGIGGPAPRHVALEVSSGGGRF